MLSWEFDFIQSLAKQNLSFCVFWLILELDSPQKDSVELTDWTILKKSFRRQHVRTFALHLVNVSANRLQRSDLSLRLILDPTAPQSLRPPANHRPETNKRSQWMKNLDPETQTNAWPLVWKRSCVHRPGPKSCATQQHPLEAINKPLHQGCQTHFRRGPHRPHGGPQRAGCH